MKRRARMAPAVGLMMDVNASKAALAMTEVLPLPLLPCTTLGRGGEGGVGRLKAGSTLCNYRGSHVTVVRGERRRGVAGSS